MNVPSMKMKRLNKEEQENKVPGELYFIYPLKNNKHIWHFTLMGHKKTAYEGGLFHGKIVLPQNYPFKPPDLIFFNENGRFQPNTKICLTITAFFSKTWTPAWSLRTMIEAIHSIFLDIDNGTGFIKTTNAQKKQMAKTSRNYICTYCGKLPKIEKFIKENRLKKG